MPDAALSPTVLDRGQRHPAAPNALVEACGLPEIGPRLAGASVRIDDSFARPLRVDGATISITSDIAEDFVAAASMLREAVELRSLQAQTGMWVSRILAHVVASLFSTTVLRKHTTQRPISQLVLPLDASDLEDPATTCRRVAEFLMARDGTESPAGPDALEQAEQALELSVPLEMLIASGGDDRQRIDWSTGENSYGLPSGPTPWRVSFGSCTASTPTPRSFEAAEQLRRRLLHARIQGAFPQLLEAESERLRTTIRAALGIEEVACEVVFTPSGTDAELIALAGAVQDNSDVRTIIVGEKEIGSGSVPAAKGLHFSTSLPSGEPGELGTGIDGFGMSRVDYVEIPFRDARGLMLDPAEVERLIGDAIEEWPGRVLLHVVEGSKTGIRLPREATVTDWEAKHGDRLLSVVDAAQMRIDQETVREHLSAGRIVFITGSKFFGGPPFSGAVLIPESRTPLFQGSVRSMPPGLGAYLTRVDVPPVLDALHGVTEREYNLGLLLRWEAAVTEMRSFHNASPEIRDRVLGDLAVGIRSLLESSPSVAIVESPYTTIPEKVERSLDDLPTIFTFQVDGPDGKPLGFDVLKKAHRLLDDDLSDHMSMPRGLESRPFYLGQPVRLAGDGGDAIAALRIAIGAPTVSRIVFDVSRGEHWTERLRRELSDLSDALTKLEAVVGYVTGTGGPASAG